MYACTSYMGRRRMVWLVDWQGFRCWVPCSSRSLPMMVRLSPAGGSTGTCSPPHGQRGQIYAADLPGSLPGAGHRLRQPRYLPKATARRPPRRPDVSGTCPESLFARCLCIVVATSEARWTRHRPTSDRFSRIGDADTAEFREVSRHRRTSQADCHVNACKTVPILAKEYLMSVVTMCSFLIRIGAGTNKPITGC